MVRSISKWILAAALLPSIPVHAQWAVYDAANHFENIRQTVQEIVMTGLNERQLAEEVVTALNTGKQYAQMLKDNQVRLNSLRGMQPSEILALAKTLGGELAVYADLADRVTRADRNLRSVLDMYRDIERLGNYTNMTPEQIFWQERYRRQQENSYTRDRFTNIQRTLFSVQGDIQKIGQLAQAIPDTHPDGEQSLRKSLEVIAAHLNVIAGQNTQLLSILAEDGAARSASALSERTITEARDLNEFRKRQLEQIRIRMRYQSLADAARQRWNSFGP